MASRISIVILGRLVEERWLSTLTLSGLASCRTDRRASGWLVRLTPPFRSLLSRVLDGGVLARLELILRPESIPVEKWEGGSRSRQRTLHVSGMIEVIDEADVLQIDPVQQIKDERPIVYHLFKSATFQTQGTPLLFFSSLPATRPPLPPLPSLHLRQTRRSCQTHPTANHA
jgi:hypothetical protein